MIVKERLIHNNCPTWFTFVLFIFTIDKAEVEHLEHEYIVYNNKISIFIIRVFTFK